MNNVPDRVFVLYDNKSPAMPCFRGRAWHLLKAGRAAVYRLVPFTIILKDRTSGDAQPVELRLDPGSKTSGIAVVANDTVVFAANLQHRGQAVKKALEQRRALRRGRRARKTRYRAPRFDNRTRPENWLPPSLLSRVDNVVSWARRLAHLAPLTSIAVETVRFDTQQMQNPEISGVAYQQGTLAGYEMREYLLEKWNRTCAYCGAKNVPLQIEHIQARANGGSDRVANLTLACEPCNVRKGTHDVAVFLARKPNVLKKLLAQAKAPLKDAAAVNSTRKEIGRRLVALGLPTSFWSGGRTKMNRVAQGYHKDHWIDAACVGENGAHVRIATTIAPLGIKALGRGSRLLCRPDRYGFPRLAAKSVKRIAGFQTGDLVRLAQPSGKYAGTHIGTVAVRARGDFDLRTAGAIITSAGRNFTLLQRTNGYAYAAA